MDSGDSKKPQTDDDDRKVMTGTVETLRNRKQTMMTESQCVMMKKSCAKELGLEYSPLDKPIVIRGFGHGLANAIGKLTTEVKIDEAVGLTEILVVPDDHVVIIRRVRSWPSDGNKCCLDTTMEYHTKASPSSDARIPLNISMNSNLLRAHFRRRLNSQRAFLITTFITSSSTCINHFEEKGQKYV
ncbi:hypothetical protein QE152_g14143 [Popillia japonica]|uniref:Uncharacterized protein n=1 Tax=Popillia japonica TaxID=7064 RepID=A0AAW1LAX5_POPJA